MNLPPHARQRAFSLVEVTLVIGLMITLAGIVTFSVSAISTWSKGRDAGEKLRSVYMAQKAYLADKPAKTITTFTAEELIPYLPGRPGALPTQVGLSGETLSIKITAMPPVFTKGSTAYDPSGSTTDALWDVGSL
ncbi:MAG TPA: type II secretion system protein [Bacteroidia bacterium]|nr:type II secretion system protein [Bacteroidia bacterium]